MWQKTCPAIYRDTNPAKLPDKKHYQEVMAWTPGYFTKGICAVGKARTGKSRSMWMLLGRLWLDQSLRVQAWESGAWQEWSTARNRDGDLHSRLVEICMTSCCVFIDDCWKQGMTVAQEWAIWELMEVASSRGCAIHLTTNASGKDLIDQASEESEALRIRPMLARVREFCDPILFTQETP